MRHIYFAQIIYKGSLTSGLLIHFYIRNIAVKLEMGGLYYCSIRKWSLREAKMGSKAK